MNLLDNGFILEFEPFQQTLKKILVYKFTSIKIYYNNSLISRNSPPSFSQIYKLFGPTTPGRYDDKKMVYSLLYPSLIFNFAIPQQYNDLFVEKYSIRKRDIEIPVNLPDNSSPLLDHLILFEGERPNLISSKIDPKEKIQVDLMREIVKVKGGELKIGISSPQDVISILGTPNEIIQKGENKMKIHHNISSKTDHLKNCCLYNYFDLGMDIIFDFENYRIISIILHTNLISHPDFSVYSKCNFSVSLDPELSHPIPLNHQSNNEMRDPPSSSEKNEQEMLDFQDTEISFSIKKKIEIDSHQNWKQIEKEIGNLGHPIIHDSNESIFGPSYFHGHSNFYFEIMKNGYISSFSIFSI